MRIMQPGFLFASVFATAMLSACGSGAGDTADTGSSLNSSPGFVLKDLEGKEVSSADFNGKVLVIDFWATWCKPCRLTIPSLVQLHTKFRESGLEVIGISLDRNPDQVLPRFIKEYKIAYPVLLADSKVIKDFGGVQYIPTMFIVDKNGNIHSKHVGMGDFQEVEKSIQQLL